MTTSLIDGRHQPHHHQSKHCCNSFWRLRAKGHLDGRHQPHHHCAHMIFRWEASATPPPEQKLLQLIPAVAGHDVLGSAWEESATPPPEQWLLQFMVAEGNNVGFLDPREHALQLDSGVPITMEKLFCLPPFSFRSIPDAHVPRGPVSATRCFVILVLPTSCTAIVALHSLPDQFIRVEVRSAEAGACCFVCCKWGRTSSGWTQRGSSWAFVCCKWGPLPAWSRRRCSE